MEGMSRMQDGILGLLNEECRDCWDWCMCGVIGLPYSECWDSSVV